MTTGEGTRVKKVLAAILLAIGGMMAGAGALTYLWNNPFDSSL